MDRPVTVNVHESLKGVEDRSCLVMDDDGPFPPLPFWTCAWKMAAALMWWKCCKNSGLKRAPSS